MLRGSAFAVLSVQVNATLEFVQLLDKSRPHVLLSVDTIKPVSNWQ